jgi:hypothetical protein
LNRDVTRDIMKISCAWYWIAASWQLVDSALAGRFTLLLSVALCWNMAIAEKISILRTEEFFRVRAAGADVARARSILKRAGKEPLRQGDEIPADGTRKRTSKRSLKD